MPKDGKGTQQGQTHGSCTSALELCVLSGHPGWGEQGTAVCRGMPRATPNVHSTAGSSQVP